MIVDIPRVTQPLVLHATTSEALRVCRFRDNFRRALSPTDMFISPVFRAIKLPDEAVIDTG